MRRDGARSRGLALAGMTLALTAAVVAFGYTMAAGIPHHASNPQRDWLAVGVLTAAGIVYVGWAAISNRSVVVGLLGSTEILLVSPIAFLLFRYPARLSLIPGVVVAVTLFAFFLYPWTQVDRIRRAIAKHTGIS